MANIEALLTMIPRELADGNIVHLGDFGSFHLRVKSEGADTSEGVNAKNVKNVLVTFTPGKEFKQVLNNITFEKDSS